MARIELHQVGLNFRVKHNTAATWKDFVLGLGRRPRGPKELPALRDVTLEIGQGDRVGIVGLNGAGKSTLLKVIAGVYQPSAGRRVVAGRISSLFDLILGFEGDSNGWDNIRYRGYLQGETPAGIRAKAQAIAEFSELGAHLDMPVRYYSAGMVFRLAFAIATAIDPEILLLDEVFNVGDLAFQAKAQRRMEELITRAKLMVMVNHDVHVLARMCTKGVWLDRGQVRMVGPMQAVLDTYIAWVFGGQPQAA